MLNHSCYVVLGLNWLYVGSLPMPSLFRGEEEGVLQTHQSLENRDWTPHYRGLPITGSQSQGLIQTIKQTMNTSCTHGLKLFFSLVCFQFQIFSGFSLKNPCIYALQQHQPTDSVSALLKLQNKESCILATHTRVHIGLSFPVLNSNQYLIHLLIPPPWWRVLLYKTSRK